MVSWWVFVLFDIVKKGMERDYFDSLFPETPEIPEFVPRKYKFVKKTCGNVVYVSEYDRVRFKVEMKSGRNGRSSSDEPDKKTREDSIKRARRQIFSIVEGNYDDYELPVFITLTYEKNLLDVSEAVHDFRNFLRRYSRSIFGSDSKLCYIAVAERQDRGAIHFHAVFFNLPRSLVKDDLAIISIRKKFSGKKKRDQGRSWTFREFLELPQKYFTSLDIWKLGFSDMRLLDKTLNGKPIERVAAYVAKYLGKENIHRFGRWNYLASRGLKRPDVQFMEFDPDIQGDIMEVVVHEHMNHKLKITKFVV